MLSQDFNKINKTCLLHFTCIFIQWRCSDSQRVVPLLVSPLFPVSFLVNSDNTWLHEYLINNLPRSVCRDLQAHPLVPTFGLYFLFCSFIRPETQTASRVCASVFNPIGSRSSLMLPYSVVSVWLCELCVRWCQHDDEKVKHNLLLLTYSNKFLLSGSC